MPAHLRAFVLACVQHLVHQQRVPLEQLVRQQYPLLQRLALRIAELRDRAAKASFTQLVLDGGWTLETSVQQGFHFDPDIYPVSANKRYCGKFRFAKHFYPVVADLEDGGEEWRCALALDEHPQVRHWVRNLACAWCSRSTLRWPDQPAVPAGVSGGRRCAAPPASPAAPARPASTPRSAARAPAPLR